MNTAAPASALPDTEQERPKLAPPESRGRLSFLRLVRSEWIKFTTLRSTWWSLALVAVVSVGLSLLQASAIASFGDDMPAATTAEQANADAVVVIVFATVLTQLLAVIIGTINVTGEYSTGMIRSTITAAPDRIRSLLAKALVVSVTMFVFSLIVFALAALITAPILPNGGVDFSDIDSSLMPLLAAALYLALLSALGVGFGYIIRNGPGALAVGIGIVFVAPVLVLFFPMTETFDWVHQLASYLPSNAGQSLFMGSPMSGEALDTAPGLIAIIAWPLAALAGGIAVLKSRDA
ncbi:ABC transporter permease subunit [Agrococcus casei]|uniref:ABC transporter, integral membrane subunit n=1 Tax=Agrococcus casei LMG 22410 TaxID=1255656 RepID=A0A1R4G6M4_9MICO|nr:ABC transporter permease [Agrococcus casei]SJM63743.1 ABC transporter, integral membrane subunit [Agrococcus casei LMG 22410]